MGGIDNMQVCRLDGGALLLQWATMSKKLLPLVLVVGLAACNQEDHTIVAGPDFDREVNAAAEANIVLPPSITASASFRCADNTIVYVDWLSDGKSANLRTDKGASPTVVTAAEAGKPLTAEGGYSLDGAQNAKSVKIALPGKSAQTCNG